MCTGLDLSFDLLYDLSYTFQSYWIIFKKKPLLKTNLYFRPHIAVYLPLL